jgi:hypothetical protein
MKPKAAVVVAAPTKTPSLDLRIASLLPIENHSQLVSYNSKQTSPHTSAVFGWFRHASYSCRYRITREAKFAMPKQLDRQWPVWVDAVEKVENRTTPKISQMVIFGLPRRYDAL